VKDLCDIHQFVEILYLSMKTVEEPESRQSANDRDDIENKPLFNRHNVEERIWEFPIDCRSVFDPCRVDQSEGTSEEGSSSGRCWRSKLFF
jgi:hypothetical protein